MEAKEAPTKRLQKAVEQLKEHDLVYQRNDLEWELESIRNNLLRAHRDISTAHYLPTDCIADEDSIEHIILALKKRQNELMAEYTWLRRYLKTLQTVPTFTCRIGYEMNGSPFYRTVELTEEGVKAYNQLGLGTDVYGQIVSFERLGMKK